MTLVKLKRPSTLFQLIKAVKTSLMGSFVDLWDVYLSNTLILCVERDFKEDFEAKRLIFQLLGSMPLPYKKKKRLT